MRRSYITRVGAEPASWKTKCTIRRVDDLGRFIDPEPVSTKEVTSTLRMPSLAPFAVDVPVARWADLEDRLEPARNSDVLGVRSTQEVPTGYGSSFWAGVASGFMALTLAASIGFAALTADEPDQPRDRRAAVHLTAATLDVAHPDYAYEKAPPGSHRTLQWSEVVTPDMLPDAR